MVQRASLITSSGRFEQLFDVFYFFFNTDIAFFNGLFNLVEVHHDRYFQFGEILDSGVN